jgi:hypothetical protein
MIQKVFVVAGLVCGIVAFVLVAFASGQFKLAIEFAAAGVVALGAALVL